MNATNRGLTNDEEIRKSLYIFFGISSALWNCNQVISQGLASPITVFLELLS